MTLKSQAFTTGKLELLIAETGEDDKERLGKNDQELSSIHVKFERLLNIVSTQDTFLVGTRLYECGIQERYLIC